MDKIKQSQAVNLLRSYELLLKEAIDSIKREQEAPITGTAEEIALEYKYRQGVKQGAQLVLMKLNSYVRED
jgi:hypothetical protein